MKTSYKIIILVLALLASFVAYNTYKRATSPQFKQDKAVIEKTESKQYEKIVLAGGCFWCTESQFHHLNGVVSSVSGYADSNKENPNYEEVSSESIKARESVEVTYDPKLTNIKNILEAYWRHINPTDIGGQFSDQGHQYTTAIYYTTEEQKIAAETSKKKIDESKKFAYPIATLILPFVNFYPAEEYHQNYKDKNPVRYQVYSEGSGRNAFIRANWADNSPFVKEIFGIKNNATSTVNNITNKKMNISQPWKKFTATEKEERLKTLTPLQFNVTQKEGTERPFQNEYNGNKEKGIYVDIVSGEPLYLSSDKYDSGTGWPSFVKPISDDVVSLKVEDGIFSSRTEVRSKIADSHLGHVFDDGPADRGGKRYCMNSAAFRFVPLADMEKEGYGEYVGLIK